MNKRVEQSLAAEYELALIWMLKDFDIEIEPSWIDNTRRPDVYIEGLIDGTPAVIEITAIADNSMSGEPQMDFCATSLMKVANEIQRGSGDFLYFLFSERRKYNHGRYERHIAAPPDYKPSEDAKERIARWLRLNPDSDGFLDLVDREMSVTIEKRPFKHRRLNNFHTSRPPMVYSDTRNPVYTALSNKASQISRVPDGLCRVIFLADAGSRFLSEVCRFPGEIKTQSPSTPATIINRFLADYRNKVNAVVVFVPIKRAKYAIFYGDSDERRWGCAIFGEDNAINQQLVSSLNALIVRLPPPRWDGFNARSLTRQGALRHDSRGRYLATTMRYRDGEMTFRLSSRLFQDFLARRIDEKQFRYFLGERDEHNGVGQFLSRGYTIKNITLEPGGLDEDDDYIVMHFDQDPAAAPFK
jgi:hypothetical protein